MTIIIVMAHNMISLAIRIIVVVIRFRLSKEYLKRFEHLHCTSVMKHVIRDLRGIGYEHENVSDHIIKSLGIHAWKKMKWVTYIWFYMYIF